MRILWLLGTTSLPTQTSKNGYNGGGWASSLIEVVKSADPSIEHGCCLIQATDKLKASELLKESPLKKIVINKDTYYPIQLPSKTLFRRILTRYGLQKIRRTDYVNEIRNVIADFKPDVIYLFGIENRLAHILGNTDIPVLLHLQGLLAPYSNAFYPPGINGSNYPLTLRDIAKHSNPRFSKSRFEERAELEKQLFKDAKFCLGRTKWDYQVSQLLAPQSEYFEVNEVLRPLFYANAGKWRLNASGKLIITSTISQTIYKGFDLVLKTAQLLKEAGVDFKWNLIGVHASSKFVKDFERIMGIRAEDVNVSFKGVLAPQGIIDTLLNTRVYVHPSYIDNSPNSICEAQMLGVPVVACNAGGVASLLDEGRAGCLVPANAPYELAYHLRQFQQDSSYFEKERVHSTELSRERHSHEAIFESLMKAINFAICNK